ncbi:MAG: L,D-transpeptidase family protein [Siphonobacter sp.]
MKLLFFCLFGICYSIFAAGQNLQKRFGAKQLVVVTTNDFSTIYGELTIYELKNSKWLKINHFPVVIGKNGFAWGNGILNNIPSAEKREGDGKSPAGVFSLGTAFGSAKPIEASKWPYLLIDNTCFCVDDSKSMYYNKIINTDTTHVDWSSAEKMLIPVYERGLVINDNTSAETNKGSCIFMHIWNSPDTGTAGCTAMSKTNLDLLLRWLDPAKKPLLVQMPKQEYSRIQSTYMLP